MHELSIAMSLVEAAAEKAASLGSPRVQALHVRIGPLSGVVKDALLFCFDLAAEGSAVVGARLAIEDVPLVGHCPRCDAERELPGPWSLACPQCEAPISKIVKGRELELFALELDEDAAAHR
jgi:hydrogenase nickel incorporation protein HypA/HybF